MLTNLQQQLATAHGLAIAATPVTVKVEARTEPWGLRRTLQRMRDEAEETRGRCQEVAAAAGDDLARELTAVANSVHETSADLVGAWFKAGTSPLAAWTFLTMAEAAEVAAWEALGRLARRAADGAVSDLAAWALEVQRRHLRDALDGVANLAGRTDPAAPRWG
jgi:hypothetical protein